MMSLLPQFPLGTVLFPSMVLPLHIFEIRYRVLIQDLLDSESQTFGVVLIERGSDVGGDDQRSSVGTLTKLIKAEQFPDGRWNVVTVGTERFRVQEWHDDDPYPKAEIELWPDADEGVVNQDRFTEVHGRFERMMALASEAGVDTGALPQLEPTALGTMQLSALLPIEAFDKQRLLSLPGANERLDAIDGAISDTLELVELKLGRG
jgi:Lon protease-like protein